MFDWTRDRTHFNVSCMRFSRDKNDQTYNLIKKGAAISEVKSRFGVDLGVYLESIRGQFGVDWESVQDQFGTDSKKNRGGFCRAGRRNERTNWRNNARMNEYRMSKQNFTSAQHLIDELISQRHVTKFTVRHSWCLANECSVCWRFRASLELRFSRKKHFDVDASTYERLYFVPYERICSEIAACKLFGEKSFFFCAPWSSNRNENLPSKIFSHKKNFGRKTFHQNFLSGNFSSGCFVRNLFVRNFFVQKLFRPKFFRSKFFRPKMFSSRFAP